MPPSPCVLGNHQAPLALPKIDLVSKNTMMNKNKMIDGDDGLSESKEHNDEDN